MDLDLGREVGDWTSEVKDLIKEVNELRSLVNDHYTDLSNSIDEAVAVSEDIHDETIENRHTIEDLSFELEAANSTIEDLQNTVTDMLLTGTDSNNGGN